MSVSVWQADGKQPVREVDVLVVGAGIVGTAAALAIRRLGREPVITEARDVALGASGRNAGFMITGLDAYYHHAIARYGHDATREVYALSQRTHALWHDLISAHGVRFERIGSMLLAESEAEAAELRDAYAAMLADGLTPVFHDGDPLGRGYCAAIEQPQDGAVQPVELAYAALRESGAVLVENNELYAIEPGDGYVTVRTRKYTFRAQKVLLCTNAYSMYVHPYFVGKVIPTRAQVLATAPLDKPAINTCGYSDYGYMYYRMDFDGRLLIGGGRKQNKPAEHDTSDDRTTAGVQGILDAYLRQRFPDVTAPVERRWAGIMGFTPDGLPLVGTLPDMPDVGFAVGFNGHGLAMGAATAEVAAAHLLTGASPGVLSAQRDLSLWAAEH
ncbi:MAG: FAD-binding oxidoreductase [Anaerolineae bacterium]|jgi:glycine/D-amino acid oxidase-like deaminating enzyme|nr:FAD-binding oxidoreductase [Anaerolineae bacterium]